LSTLARGLGLFVVFYSAAWAGWFTLLTGGDFAHFFEFFIQAWSLGAWGLPLLVQTFALATALISTWVLHALETLGWF